MKIARLDIEGFRSLRKISWQPGDLNVVIGPNGSGKSNLLRFLELIAVSAQGRLGKYIQSLGGMDPIVWDGVADSIKFSLDTVLETDQLSPEHYELELIRLGVGSLYKADNELLTNSYKLRHKQQEHPFKFLEKQGNRSLVVDQVRWSTDPFTQEEESLLSFATGPFIQNRFLPLFRQSLSSIAVYQDFRTDKDASIRQASISRLEKRVDPDGQNLIAVLHTLYTSDRDFKRDINSAMHAAFGDDFEELVFPPASDQRIQLRIRWKSLKREQSAADLSDGTLRFLFLLTVLASPDPPPVIAIDEPETGLHPSMLPVIAEFAQDAATRSQIIFTTHSPQFLDAFTDARPTTTVALWENGETVLRVLPKDELDYWLKDYSLGTLFRSGELEQMG